MVIGIDHALQVLNVYSWCIMISSTQIRVQLPPLPDPSSAPWATIIGSNTSSTLQLAMVSIDNWAL